MIHAFTQGLMDGDFFRSLIRKSSRDYDHMLKKVSEYINVEEAQAARKKETPAELATPTESRQPTTFAIVGVSSRSLSQGTIVVDHLRLTGIITIKMLDGERLDNHPSSDIHSNQEATPEPPKNGLDRLLERKKIEATPLGGKSTSSPGGPTSGDSNRARKSYARRLEVHVVGCSQEKANGPEISFGPSNLEGVEMPHDDALIIRAVIANYTIQRIFIDIGSSVNIIFKRTFDQLQIDSAELLPMTTPLFGFTGNEVQPVGQIKLVISLGEEPLRRTRTTNFIVVDAPSAYNVILGRPALSEFRAVVSTFYHKIKFPVEDQVGEVRGDQLAVLGPKCS
ncbi:uncharacterized protein LOC122026831 [Zingiber officinale]|uniref:uncharacterized protein LOC122026831 n=1 Tax=Zingiber officinale TaxID=94328 RepID=UPI001C4AF038|nr:uncharacterized protein LOC122026831 [Zingiber officinale]